VGWPLLAWGSNERMWLHGTNASTLGTWPRRLAHQGRARQW